MSHTILWLLVDNDGCPIGFNSQDVLVKPYAMLAVTQFGASSFFCGGAGVNIKMINIANVDCHLYNVKLLLGDRLIFLFLRQFLDWVN